ncbi:MAG TPA: molybdate ABC transporter substrate-binding protein [Methanoregulaceae archaeon]|nr:MAG: molybdate ABC transporter substrate-binding protein [Methanolinea sp.]HON80839.1 molybdate ABC transporter substrate-binding protein [Methanoregulaceae archaeon]HPD09574.1 molybdate ABC transporter substrate-binding protein [Methanoregulaceae archaeon]HRT15245.1 molybdate ABC transporter substrate-binding protein [Methanoregulaceae archaeon]HRU30816.1 molybdate ABC transporter substrate-binding protein [Methanoregulaceae archaeon]
MEKSYKFVGIMGLFLIVGFLLLSAGCTEDKEAPLNVYVAAGLKKPMDVVIAKYTNATGITVIPNYGPSGGLYTQISQGQPCDLYYSADYNLIEKLEAEGKVSEAEKFMNEFVVLTVSKTGREKGITTASNLTGKNIVVAVADPSAPVGVYSENVLKNLGLWDQLNALGNIKTRPGTVNQVALMVQSDEIDAGFTYSSTAVLYNLDTVEKYSYDLSEEIVFGDAVIKGGNEAGAKAFRDFVRQNSDEFTQYGWELYA